MLKVKMFIVKWLYKITNDKRWVRLYIDLMDIQVRRILKRYTTGLAFVELIKSHHN